jgi:hypothetical protein
MGVGAASRDAEVAGLRTELAGMTRMCEIMLDTSGRLMAENAALHSEVTRLGVGLRQWQGRSAELQGMLDGTVRAPVLPTSANPEHVRRMAEVLRAAMNGAELSFEAEARAALDVLPELVGKS